MVTNELVSSVLALAQRAGDAIMTTYNRGDATVTEKDDRSPLTEADLASHRVIVAGLEDLPSSGGPRLPVLSEEARAMPYDVRRTWQRFWLVDPLDGTKEFIKRNGEFTVNIALVESGAPVLGVVHAPVLGRTYFATAAGGAFRRDGDTVRRISVAARAPTIEIVASRSHGSAETEEFLKRFGADHAIHLVAIGSSLKLCLVAEGVAHLYPRFGPTMEWDTAAAQCIVEAAGGRVTDLEAHPLIYNKENLLNPHFVVAVPEVEWRTYL